jgi:2-haloacid dehalogenase
MTLKLSHFKLLSFDCYGTLIDWETGIWHALHSLVSQSEHQISRDEALTAFAQFEPEQEIETPHLLYREILSKVHAKLASFWGIHTTDEMNNAFGVSVGDWPAFPDTVEALGYLKQHYSLVILSNVDRLNFSSTSKRLATPFDAVCTAEDIGTYKPNLRNFEYLVEKCQNLGVQKKDILHVAQSLYHDQRPAERIGLARCWINRRHDTGKGSGATKAVDHLPVVDFQFPSLAALAEAHRNDLMLG